MKTTMILESEKYEEGFRASWRILLNGNLVAVAASLAGARSYIARARRFIVENDITTLAQFKAVDLQRGTGS